MHRRDLIALDRTTRHPGRRLCVGVSGGPTPSTLGCTVHRPTSMSSLASAGCLSLMSNLLVVVPTVVSGLEPRRFLAAAAGMPSVAVPAEARTIAQPVRTAARIRLHDGDDDRSGADNALGSQSSPPDAVQLVPQYDCPQPLPQAARWASHPSHRHRCRRGPVDHCRPLTDRRHSLPAAPRYAGFWRIAPCPDRAIRGLVAGLIRTPPHPQGRGRGCGGLSDVAAWPRGRVVGWPRGGVADGARCHPDDVDVLTGGARSAVRSAEGRVGSHVVWRCPSVAHPVAMRITAPDSNHSPGLVPTSRSPSRWRHRERALLNAVSCIRCLYGTFE